MRDSHSKSGGGGQTRSPEALFPSLTKSEIRGLAWEHCGITRSGDGLRTACRTLAAAKLEPIANADREHYELRNIHSVAHLIARSALAREESRGGHYRSDFPETREMFQKHSLISLGGEVSFA